MRLILIMAAAALGLSACALGPAAPAASGAARLAAMLDGTWSSAAQNAADPAYDVIITRMVPLPDLTPDEDRDGGDGDIWLYSESARADRLDQPYRQNIVRLSDRPGGGVEAEQFKIAAPGRYARWRPGAAAPARSELSRLEGCTVLYVADADGFDGAMAPGACRNRYKNADHLDSRTQVSPGLLVTWDRGFKDDGTYVWGPKAGGYRFVRIGGA